MKKTFCSWGRVIFIAATAALLPLAQVQAEAQPGIVYVDGLKGNDDNPGSPELPLRTIGKAVETAGNEKTGAGTVRINRGVYVLTTRVSVNAEVTIEASVMPDDSAWKPELMPVVLSVAPKGEIPDNYNFVAAFLINAGRVTIRGLKFTGHAYPNTRYFPIARFDKTKTGLRVEQCMFAGEEDSSHLQVGVIAHGNGVMIDHCVFYKVKNSVVFWEDDGSGIKTGNGMTNSIVYGATQSGVWTAWPDKEFTFRNNIIANCNHAWVKNSDNTTVYTLENCVIAGNRNYQTVSGATLFPRAFKVTETNIVKNGEIKLRTMDDNADNPLPLNYLHVMPGTPGSELGAGLFTAKK